MKTLVRICRVLNTTPNEMLGFSDGRTAKKKSERDRMLDRLVAATGMLDDRQLKLAVRQIEAMVDS